MAVLTPNKKIMSEASVMELNYPKENALLHQMLLLLITNKK